MIMFLIYWEIYLREKYLKGRYNGGSSTNFLLKITHGINNFFEQNFSSKNGFQIQKTKLEDKKHAIVKPMHSSLCSET